MNKYYLAIDIGASSGRHVIGYKENDEIKYEEVYRFPNILKKVDGHLFWDIEAIFSHVLEGIKIAIKKYPSLESLSIDTWGVDYVLIDSNFKADKSYSYRDERTLEIIDEVHKIIPFYDLYQRTGIQFQTFNTIYQLYKDKVDHRLNDKIGFLMIPEYLIYLLTGVMVHEETNASTTGLINLKTHDWDYEIIDKLKLPRKLFTTIYKSGTFVGDFKKDIKNKVGKNLKVYLCPTHDTASAVEGLDSAMDTLYLSSGTWSLLGIKSLNYFNDLESLKGNWSNEKGPSYYRYQKNIMGMWIINKLKEELCPTLDFKEIIELTKKSNENQILDINHKDFLSPISMKETFDKYVSFKNLSIGDYFKIAYLSLVESYRLTIKELEEKSSKKFDRIVIIGGGAKNTYLNSLIEEKCNIKVIVGPIEATSLGNIKSQIGGN